SAERLDAPDAVEYVAAPAARAAAQRVDRADDARLPAQLIRQDTGAQLVRNREYQPIQVGQPQQLRQQRVEIVRQNVHRNEDGVEAAAAEFRGEHLGRAHLLETGTQRAQQ